MIKIELTPIQATMVYDAICSHNRYIDDGELTCYTTEAEEALKEAETIVYDSFGNTDIPNIEIF